MRAKCERYVVVVVVFLPMRLNLDTILCTD